MRTCNDCIYFKKDACSIKGDCFKPLISPSQIACSYFKSKGIPNTGIGQITKAMLASMAIEIARNTLYDMADWKAIDAPKGNYPKLKKVLKKWLEELGVVIWE